MTETSPNANNLPPVVAEEQEYSATAAALAEELGTDCLQEAPAAGLFLRYGAGGLSLCGDGLELRCELDKMLPRLAKCRIGGEMLVKAAKFRTLEGPFCAVDATAGFGEDSLLLAAAGYKVRLYEYNPVIFALLRDGLRRAAENPGLADIVARMEPFRGDSTEALRSLDFVPDLVLLDPMFPGRQKSGLIKKKFQLLQRLEAPCGTEEALLSAAIAANPRRIVIKRPAKGPYLAGAKPSYSIDGDSIRYDCIVIR